ncbi:hypothetical protein [Parasitella parasitica]|uniref:Uncharacterized protein n=1 Tax=Parasitella parasitica TaxID=35722 RepID=A0A0B7NFR0_9FUNG|nr:hypothetical protein [Parasitella parasitica]
MTLEKATIYLCDAFSRAPTTPSPGMDALSYQLVHLIVTNPACREIALATFNNALTHSDLPPSWLLESCKKGPPPELLQNWLPISLINTDTQVFTRILSSRMIDQAATLIKSFQAGFLIMEHARNSKSSSIGLLLDQKKAYDRAHPVYLCAVLRRFGFPVALVDSISHLFFDNHLVVNVNGSHLQVCSAASNALVNSHKMEAISLSGSADNYASIWRSPLHQHRITSWHDATWPSPIRYLGFPLYTLIATGNFILPRPVGFLGFYLSNSSGTPPDPPPPPLDHRTSLLSPGRRPAICKTPESSWSLLFRVAFQQTFPPQCQPILCHAVSLHRLHSGPLPLPNDVLGDTNQTQSRSD